MNTPARGPESSPRLALLCNPYHRGGIERFMADLAVAWPRIGGECYFVIPRPRTPFRNAGTSHSVASILHESAIAAPGLRMIEPFVGREFEFGTEAYRASVYVRALLDAVPEGVPVITSDDPAAWRAASWLSPRNAAVFVVHGDYDGYYARLERYGPDAAAIVPISRRIEARVRERALGSSARVEYIPTGIAIEHAPVSKPRDGDHKAHLLWVGRMDESSKRVSDLPRIAALLDERGVDFRLTLVGDGESRQMLEDAVDRSNLRGRIKFHGWAKSSDVRAMLALSDVMLLPSNREGLPVSMMEALAAGCAVVASRVSGVEDYESHAQANGCLWVHAVGEVNAAAALVIEALAVPREERARQARKLAEAEFSIERCAQRYADLIARLPQKKSDGHAMGPARQRLIEWASLLVAAQRRLRLWAGTR